MPPKIPENRRWLWLALLGVIMAAVLMPLPAHAYNFYSPPINGVDPSGVDVCPGFGLTRRLMPCIKENIVFSVNSFLGPFSTFMKDTVAVLCTLAIALWGAMALTGQANIAWRDATVLVLKIGFVVFFTVSFAGFFPLLLDSMDYMVSIVTSYASYSASLGSCLNDPTYGVLFSNNVAFDAANTPSYLIWDYVDCAIQAILGGIFSPGTLVMGLIGFLVCCLFSSAAGFFIALMGFYLIYQMLAAIARALYIYLMAYTAFALMVLVSPIFIPLILFRTTRGYFAKWLRLTASFMVQPIIIFAYLAMLLAAFDTVIFTGKDSLFRAIAYDTNQLGITVDTPGFEIGKWMQASGAYVPSNMVDPAAVNVDPDAAYKKLGMGNTNTGIGGQIADAANVTANDWQKTLTNPFGILGVMGVGVDPNTGKSDSKYLNFSTVETPATAISWDMLAAINNTDKATYLINLFLICFMALITGYIFMTMLEALPYISAAVAGKPVTPGAGFGGGKLLGNFIPQLGGGKA